MTALAQLDDLQRHLHTLRTDPLALPALARCAQDAQTLRQALPPRYDVVLKDLLNRLESSALFSEESCSFSQRDLLDSLQLWLDKARAQLPQV